MNILCRQRFAFRLVLPAMLIAFTSARAQAPANDDFANRQSVPAGLDVPLSGTTVDATQEAFEKVNAAGSPAGESINETHTVWYDWIPAVSGTAKIIDFQDSNAGQTYLLVFEGAAPDLAHLIAQGYLPGNGDFPSAPSFPVTAGQDYTFSLGNTDFPGSFTAKLTLQPSAVAVLPVATVTASKPQAVRETHQAGKFLLTLSTAPIANLTLNYKLAGTAIAGTDYKMLSGSVTVPAGSFTAIVKVKPKAESDASGAVGVKLKLEAADGYTAGSPAEAKVKIIGGP